MAIKDFFISVAGPQPTHKRAKSDRPAAASSGWPSVAALSARRHSQAEITGGGGCFARKHYTQSFTTESGLWLP
jgi:hypothetical protein